MLQNALTLIYPILSQTTLSPTTTASVTTYTFSRGFNGHPFCKVCGCHVFMTLIGPPKEVVERMPEARKEMVRKLMDGRPVNVRCFEGSGVEEEVRGLKVVRSDEGTEGYVVGG